MSNSVYNNRNSYTHTLGNYTKINPFNPRKTAKVTNNISAKRKFLIPNSNREFGKEINVSSNLATCNNQETFNGRRTFGIPIEQKIKNLKKEKEELNNKLKNYGQIAIRKKKKDISNSLSHKPDNSNNKYYSNRSLRRITKKEINKIKNKNQSQKNIFNPNKTMNIMEDVVMNDENANPNIIANKTQIDLTVNNSVNIINDDDVEMKIENDDINIKKYIKLLRIYKYVII